MELEKTTMDILTTIRKRESVRVFTEKPISDGVMNTLLYAAQYAPTAMNARPWQFVVIRDRDILKRLAEASEYAKMLDKAPAAILVCGDRKKLPVDELLYADLAAATENILLMATGLGLGSCWCAVSKRIKFHQRVIEICKLPEKIQPFAVIALGYPEKLRGIEKPFNQEIIHQDTWTLK